MIRAIHPFGPPVGCYVPSDKTDIRVAIERERARLQLASEQQCDAAELQVDEIPITPAAPPPPPPLRDAEAFITSSGAVFA